MGNGSAERKTYSRENCLQKLSEEPKNYKCPKTKKGTISISRHISKITDGIHTKSDR